MIKLILAILAIVYIVSPVDLIPDLIPLTGWLDDAFIAGVILYFFRRGVFPSFLSWLNHYVSGDRRQKTASGFDDTNHFQRNAQDPYETLGLKPDASSEDIRAAYRQAVQFYHPDKVAHLGPELQALAKKKFVEIQKAYERIKAEK